MLRGLGPLCRSAFSLMDNVGVCACGSFASTSYMSFGIGSNSAAAAAPSAAAAAGLSTSTSQAAEPGSSTSSSGSSTNGISSIVNLAAGVSSRRSSRKPPNTPLAAPWTPTSMLTKRKTYQKRSRFLMQTLEVEQQQRLATDRQFPDFRAGDILEVTSVVPEADRKVYTYKGLCIARSNKGPRTWFKLYNVFPDAGGFVQHFPLYMPDLLSIKVVGRLPKAKRSKLYHILQDESPKHIYQTGVEVQQS